MKVKAKIINNGKSLSNEEIDNFFIEKLFQLEVQFTKEIDKFSLAHKKLKLIQLSSTLSRSTHQSRLYYDYCLLECIQDFIKKGYRVESIEVSKELESAIKKLKDRHPNAILQYSVVHTKFKLLKDFMRLIKFMSLKFIQIALIKFNFQKKRELNECDALLSSYVFQGKVAENNYFGSIIDLPKSKVVFMPVIIDVSLSGIFNVVKELKSLKNTLIFREHFLSISDVFKSLSYYFLEKDYAKTIAPKNLYHALIRSYLLESSFNTLSLEAHLNILSFEKIIKNAGPPKKIILSWENQSSEKAILFVASNYKEIDTYGFISRPIKQNEFNIIPSRQEIENNLSPKNIVVTGNKALDRFKSVNPSIKVSIGPNLRYKWKYKATVNGDNSELIDKLIFVMPGDNESFKSLQRIIFDLKDNDISKQFNIYATLHPYFKQSKKLSGVQLIDKKIEELPERSIIISVASIAALEAAAMGFRTILYIDKYNEYETSLFAKEEKQFIPIFQDTSELIKIIKEGTIIDSDLQKSIQADYFNSSVNHGIDFFYT